MILGIMRTNPVMRIVRVSMKGFLAATLIGVGLTSSCTGTKSNAAPPSSSPSTRAAASSPSATPSARSVTDFSSLAHAMRTVGVRVHSLGRVGLPGSLLGVPGHNLLIDGGHVWVFEYPTENALLEARASISPRGDWIPTKDGGLASINWDPPHFYGEGTMLVLYFGDRQRTLDVLEVLLGPQFAGG